MIPLGDEGTPPPRGFPVVNITIIVVNLAVFLLQLSTGLDGGPITNGWTLIPFEVTHGQDLIGFQPALGQDLYAAPLHNVYLTLLTSMFMHGGWLHIGS